MFSQNPGNVRGSSAQDCFMETQLHVFLSGTRQTPPHGTIHHHRPHLHLRT